MIAMVKDHDGNDDLPIVAMLGCSFWAAAWAVQVIIHLMFRYLGGLPIKTLTVGLVGLEYPVRPWSARAAMWVTSTTVMAIFTVGAMLIICESLVIGPRTLQSTVSVWTAPGFGLASRESVWLAGAWLCWIQAICQMFPLPKSLGRVWLVSLVSLLSRETSQHTQAAIARRVLRVIAMFAAFVALATISGEPNLVIPRWPLMLMLAGVLWFTARAPDIDELLRVFAVSETSPLFAREDAEQAGWAARTAQSIRARWYRRRARKALHRERSEAVDAQRLDKILDQLHESGIESLSSSERAVLNRVSQSLRRQREMESVTGQSLERNSPSSE
jgi:hypothetical protein